MIRFCVSIWLDPLTQTLLKFARNNKERLLIFTCKWVILILTNYCRQICSQADKYSYVKSWYQCADGFHCFWGHICFSQYKWELLDESFVNQINAVTKNSNLLIVQTIYYFFFYLLLRFVTDFMLRSHSMLNKADLEKHGACLRQAVTREFTSGSIRWPIVAQ